MKKRMIAVLLSMVLVFSLIIPASASEARDTDFFTPREHADVDFEDMPHGPIDTEGFLNKVDGIRALSADASNKEAVLSGFFELVDMWSEAVTLHNLAYIYLSMNAYDEAAADAYSQASADIDIVADAFNGLLRDVLLSPCASAFDGVLSDAEKAAYIAYEDMTEEQAELNAEETELENEFWRLDSMEYSVTVDGKTWTEDTILLAYYEEEVDLDTYYDVTDALEALRVESLSEVYLALVAVRNKIAKSYGYDNYGDYAYEIIYGRDYSQEDIKAFHAAVKEYIVPVFLKLLRIYRAYSSLIPSGEDYSGDNALDIMEPYVAGLSDELYESFNYMRDHNLFDNYINEEKNAQGYTTSLPYYGAAFFFDCADGSVSDLSTAIHEFGHFNNFYWTDPGWEISSKNTDISEVHSQGLELLFTEFYGEIFGKERGDALETYCILRLLDSIVEGAMQDELQQFVYASDNLTAGDIHREYRRLYAEYGLIPEDSEIEELYYWLEIHHNFTAPMYYISYAVSAAGAFSFWLDSREDYFKGVDEYLEFTALNIDYDFKESFETLGLASPISPEYIKKLAEAVYGELDIEERLRNLPVVAAFKDVKENDWFVNSVAFMYSAGLMNGKSLTEFDPNGKTTREEVVTILWRLDGAETVDYDMDFSDVKDGKWYTEAIRWAASEGIVNGYTDGSFGVGDTVTREQFAAMLYRYVESYGLGFDDEWSYNLDFKDADKISSWGYEPMCWLTMNYIIRGNTGGTLNPNGTATRAEVATMVYRLVQVMIIYMTAF